MKRIVLFGVFLLIGLLSYGQQKIAVLDFNAGVGISKNDVDGLSAVFVTYFRPNGCQIVERTQIVKVIEEQGFQKTSLTETQMIRLGEIMNLSKIVVGDVNILGGSPNIDVRVVDVQTGEVTGRDGETFSWANYRATVQKLAQRVAKQIDNTRGIQNGHEWVDLGLPSGSKWATCNVGAANSKECGNYYSWGETTRKRCFESSSYSYSSNQRVLPYSADVANVIWGSDWRMPSKEQWVELINSCSWKKDGDGYKVIGPNGNSIFLPSAGYYEGCDLYFKGAFGCYWSRIIGDKSDEAFSVGWNFLVGEDSYDIFESFRYSGYSVRPVVEQ